MTPKQRFGRWVARKTGTTWRTVSRLRFELHALRTTIVNRISPFAWSTRRRLASGRHLSVNLGSGGRGKDGWINIDVMPGHRDQTLRWDIRRGLPFANATVARYFAEHVIEHIEFREDLPQLLAEMRRTLEPGGFIRIIVPDCRRYIEAYLTKDVELCAQLGLAPLPDDMPTPMAMLNHIFHQDGEHMFGYDYETLEMVLRNAGFEGVKQMSFGRSEDPQLCLDRAEHAPSSLYVEARNPAP